MAVGSLESQPQWEVNNQTQGAKKKNQPTKHQRKNTLISKQPNSCWQYFCQVSPELLEAFQIRKQQG